MISSALTAEIRASRRVRRIVFNQCIPNLLFIHLFVALGDDVHIVDVGKDQITGSSWILIHSPKFDVVKVYEAIPNIFGVINQMSATRFEIFLRDAEGRQVNGTKTVYAET
jgi:hypothetical protein